MRGSERTKEMVYRRALAALRLEIREAQMGVDRRKIAARRNDVDVIRLHLDRLGDLRHRDLDERLQQLGQMALVLRREMHDHHERHARPFRNVMEERLQGRQPAGRRAQADDDAVRREPWVIHDYFREGDEEMRE